MSNALVRREAPQLTTVDDPILADSQLWDIVSSGDLKGLSPEQRSQYYLYRCRQERLNPASQPFTYLVLNGKGVLYGNKTAADQLRKLHGISIMDVKQLANDDYITYAVRVRDRDGREDYEIGSVFVGTAKGDQRSNADMKALTKAKRRATYSICGTGVLDETEIETVPGSKVYEDLQAAGFPERQSGGGPYTKFVMDDEATHGEPSERADQPFDDEADLLAADARDEAPDSGPITREQSRRLVELKTGLNWTIAQMRAFSQDTVGKANSNDLTEDEAAYLIERLEEEQDRIFAPA